MAASDTQIENLYTQKSSKALLSLTALGANNLPLVHLTSTRSHICTLLLGIRCVARASRCIVIRTGSGSGWRWLADYMSIAHLDLDIFDAGPFHTHNPVDLSKARA